MCIRDRKRTKNKNGYRVCSEETVPGQKPWSQSGGKKGSLGWKGFAKQVGFEPGVKKEGMMDGESSESMGEDEVADVGRDESELEWLVRDCQRVARS